MTKLMTPRQVALDILTKVFKQKSYSNIQLNVGLRENTLADRDKSLVTQIVYGTIQYKLLLEFQIAKLLKSKPKEEFIEPLLLMSVYQLFFLDKVPAHAIINEANLLAKANSKRGAYKLVNAILRSVQRQGLILPQDDSVNLRLSVKESMPQWLVEYLIDNFGQEKAEKILTSLNQPSHNSVRVIHGQSVATVQHQLAEEGFETSISPLRSNNLVAEHGGITKSVPFKEGKITIQDESSSVVVDALQVRPEDVVLDACAAPGGKTMQIAELLSESGHVTALDLHQKKLALIVENAKRLNLTGKIDVKTLDARKTDTIFSTQKFDKILVDAPCSGLGLLRRKPEIRYEKTYQDVLNLSKIQLAILESVAKTLKPNGKIVYSTCTITKEENEDVIARFLETNPDFEIEKLSFMAPYDELSDNQGTVRIFPDDFGSDGFSITSLKLRG